MLQSKRTLTTIAATLIFALTQTVAIAAKGGNGGGNGNLTAVADSGSVAADEVVILDVLSNDSGGAKLVTAVTDGTYGNVVISGESTVTYTPTPPIGANYPYTDTFTYTVTNKRESAYATGNVTITVNKPVSNVAPTASLTYSCTELDCSFTDTSSDSDGTVTAWAWNFGDGNSSSTQNPNHSYAAAGTYTVSLTATDNDGATHSTSQSVTVISAGGSANVDIRIAQPADDAEEILSGKVYLNSSDLELGYDSIFAGTISNGNQTVGLRFQNVNIPQGATITAAYLEFETDETGNSLSSVTIAAESSDNATVFTTANGNITGRITTSASVTWDIPPWNTGNQKHISPDISTVVQEVINRSGWSANNSLVFMIAGSGTRTAESHDGEPAAAPLLHVEYTTGGVVPDTSPPTVPQNVNATAISSTQVDVSWDQSIDVGGGEITGYNVFRSDVGLLATVTATSYSDTSVMPGTSYDYTVSAFDDAKPVNESAHSSPVVNVTTPSTGTSSPEAYPSSVSTGVNIPVNGMLVASDVDGDPLTYSIVTNGSIGSAVVTNQTTGAFTYTPDPGENGTDSFTFKVNDGSTDSNIAMVTVNINQLDGAPIATGGCNTTPQNQIYSGVLRATDPDADLLMYSLNTDGSGGAGPIFTAKGGMVTISNQTTGAFIYQPNIAPGDKRGADSFGYRVTDTDGLIGVAIETIIVNQTIMPLGDSITSGTGSVIPEREETRNERTGYRRTLQDNLTATGYTFDFVGTDVKGIDADPGFDYNNEGHGGWTAAQLRDGGGPTDPDETDLGTFGWLEENPADIVLLHAGTNGLISDGSNANDVAGVNSIISEIRRWEESGTKRNPVTVLLALILDQEPYEGDAVMMFNANLQTMADERITMGEDIILVDQYSALVYPDDMPDGTHPNTDGYSKMAAEWYESLQNVIDKCP